MLKKWTMFAKVSLMLENLSPLKLSLQGYQYTGVTEGDNTSFEIVVKA